MHCERAFETSGRVARFLQTFYVYIQVTNFGVLKIFETLPCEDGGVFFYLRSGVLGADNYGV